MKILIIENEIYLAQSIFSKLTFFGFKCQTIPLLEDALNYNEKADIILLSTSISGQNFYPVINKFKDSIIILMIPYINDDTVTRPLNAGAKDYIVKPFIIDELIRKIEHYKIFSQLQAEMSFYRDYLIQSLVSSSHHLSGKISFPLIIKNISQKSIDACVANYAISKKMNIEFISLLEDRQCYKHFKSLSKNQLVYIIGLECLDKEEQLECLKMLKHIPAILSFVNTDSTGLYNVYEINDKEIDSEFEHNILSVDDYVKTMILKFGNKYPDTELSKKLGMSRKSLWEKRKKYGITKKK